MGADWDPEVLESAVLATSELVTNAALHGGDRATLEVHTSGGAIRVEVYDNGRTPSGWLGPTACGPGRSAGTPPADDRSLGGRGLRIVESLSERWGVIEQPPGKVVWFEMHRHPSRPPPERA